MAAVKANESKAAAARSDNTSVAESVGMSAKGQVKVTLVLGGIGPAHAQRYVDRAMYQMMVDVVEGDTVLQVNPRRIFKPDEARPAVDDFIMDEALVQRVLDKLMQRDPV